MGKDCGCGGKCGDCKKIKATELKKGFCDPHHTGDLVYDGTEFECAVDENLNLDHGDNLNEILLAHASSLCALTDETDAVTSILSVGDTFTLIGNDTVDEFIASLSFNLTLGPGKYLVMLKGYFARNDQNSDVGSKWMDYKLVTNTNVALTGVDASDVDVAGSLGRYYQGFENTSTANKAFTVGQGYTSGIVEVADGTQKIVKAIFELFETVEYGYAKDLSLVAIRIKNN